MILLADDNRDLREALAEQLRRRGYEVTEAADGSAALELASESLDRLQALVTDFDMPGLDGLSLARKIRQERPDLRVLLITSRLPGELPSGSSSVEVLMKPFEAVEVERWLKAEPARQTTERELASDLDVADQSSSEALASSRAQQPGSAGLGPARFAAVAVSTVLLCLAWMGVNTWLSPAGGSNAASRQALPDPPAEDPTRSAAIDGLSPLGVMAAPPDRFTWNPIPAATEYRLFLTDIDELEIWSVETSAPETELPSELRARWQPLTAFYLTVQAFDAQGRLLASSVGGRLRVVPAMPAGGESQPMDTQPMETQSVESQTHAIAEQPQLSGAGT